MFPQSGNGDDECGTHEKNKLRIEEHKLNWKEDVFEDVFGSKIVRY